MNKVNLVRFAGNREFPCVGSCIGNGFEIIAVDCGRGFGSKGAESGGNRSGKLRKVNNRKGGLLAGASSVTETYKIINYDFAELQCGD